MNSPAPNSSEFYVIETEDQFKDLMTNVRLMRGISQTDLARTLGLPSQQYVSRMELELVGAKLGRCLDWTRALGMELCIWDKPDAATGAAIGTLTQPTPFAEAVEGLTTSQVRMLMSIAEAFKVSNEHEAARR